eukprot:6691742-Prymnesium_polylepis.1
MSSLIKVRGQSARVRRQPRRQTPEQLTAWAPSSQPPTALIVFHIAKTGGTALTSLLKGYSWRNLHQQRRHDLPLFLGQGLQRCFFALFPQLLPDFRPCAAYNVDWRTKQIVVEFHGLMPTVEFWSTLVPKLPQLKLLYASLNGTLLTTTTTREPHALIRSNYRMWAPSEGAGWVPFWKHVRAGGGSGLITKELLADTLVQHRRAARNFTCSKDAIERARARLAVFDVVGVTECFRRYLAALAQRVAWPFLHDEQVIKRSIERSHNEWFKPQEPDRVKRVFATTSADEELDAESQEAFDRASACDRGVYADGMRLAGVLPLIPLVSGEDAPDAMVHPPRCGSETSAA